MFVSSTCAQIPVRTTSRGDQNLFSRAVADTLVQQQSRAVADTFVQPSHAKRPAAPTYVDEAVYEAQVVPQPVSSGGC